MTIICAFRAAVATRASHFRATMGDLVHAGIVANGSMAETGIEFT
ncbi:hypothetical protein [Rhizobium sp. Root1203]|nr:hypothetical protein [Rhizobium sp. Root1203]